jgi:hypothetical protein
MTVTTIVHSFSAGVISPALYGRVDLDKWHAAASVARNMVVSYTGGMFSRAGTAFVGPCRQQASASSNPPRNIEFTFNIFQSYILEFRDNYMCVVANGGYVTETPVAVTAATNANPVVVTAPGNNFQKEGAVSRVPQLDHGQGGIRRRRDRRRVGARRVLASRRQSAVGPRCAVAAHIARGRACAGRVPEGRTSGPCADAQVAAPAGVIRCSRLPASCAALAQAAQGGQ